MTLNLMIFGFLVLCSLGMPVAYAIGFTGLVILLLDGSIPLILAPQRMFVMVNSFGLMAVPFFLLAGEFMNTGGITKRLVTFADALVGHLRGGLAHVCVVSNMFMAGVSGSSAADTAAIGGLLIPAMIRKGYDRNFSVAICCSAGCLGPIIPPSIIMILYGSLTGVSIGALFLGGVVPGVIIGGGLMVVSYVFGRTGRYVAAPRKRAPIAEVWQTFKDAGLALLLPAVILGGILSGVFTPTEAGAVAAVLSLFLGVVVYKEVRPREVPAIVLKAASSTAGVILLGATAAIFGWILAKDRFGDHALAAMQQITTNPTGILLLILLLFLIAGCFIDTFASTILLVPVLHPVAVQLGFDPIFFGVISTVLIVIGGLTPPMAPLLYIAAAIAESPSLDALPLVLFLIAAMLVCVVVLVCFPALVTFLPRVVLRS